MLEFIAMTLEDIEILRPYILQSRTRSCDDTIADVFMWRDYFAKSWAVIHDSLVIKMKYFDVDEAYMLPLGGDTKAALEAIREDCRERGVRPAFAAVTEDRLPELEAVFSRIAPHTNRDWADYVYHAADFVSFKGKKFSSQRNHINRFIRTYAGFTFEPITAESVPAILDFFREFSQDYNKDIPMVAEEEIKIREVLEHFDLYDMPGAVLKLGPSVLGFTVGEIIGDTLFVHIEKARTDINGVYPVLANEFAKMTVTPEVVWINREEDLGDPGLRRSKEGYNPAYLLDKFSVRVEEL